MSEEQVGVVIEPTHRPITESTRLIIMDEGKILLINYEDEDLHVFDTVEAALEYVDALYAEEVSK